MDVVASEVRQLGGSLDIDSDAGQGHRRSRCACRSRWRSPRRCSCASARPRFAVPIASVQRRRPHRARRARQALERDLLATAARTTRCTTSARCSATRTAKAEGQPADAAAADPLRRPARRGLRRPGPRQPRNRGQAGRSAGRLGAGHLRRDDHGRRPRRGDPRRRAAGAPPGRCCRATHAPVVPAPVEHAPRPAGHGGRRLDHDAQGHRPRARTPQLGSR